MVKASEYFKDIPIWNVDSPQNSFAICKDLSPLPITRLERWQDFQQFIENRYNTDPIKRLIFRGQRRYDWKLISTLGREENSNFSIDLEKEQFKHFRQAIRGRIQDHTLLKEKLDPNEKNELWSIGQHHGLMTPLLDWTYSPYVALFFAFIEEDTIEETLMPNEYRCIYILDSLYFTPSINDSDMGIVDSNKGKHGQLINQHGLSTISSLGINSVHTIDSEYFTPPINDFNKDSKIRIFKPNKDESGRLVSQDGLFTISSLETDIENEISNFLCEIFNKNNLSDADMVKYMTSKFACKIYIKNRNREECLQHLNYMNINHKSLFPDLHGAAYFCNSRIKSAINNLKKPIANKGSLTVIPKEKNDKYEKGKLYYKIEKILAKILNDSVPDNERTKMTKRVERFAEKIFEAEIMESLILVPQIEILALEITRQIQKLKKIYIPSHLYKNSIRAKIDLTLRKFDLKGLEYIQDKKDHVINKIMVIIKKQNDEE